MPLRKTACSHDGSVHVVSSNAENDLKFARETLAKSNLSLVLAKNRKLLFKSKSHGVADLLAMIDEVGPQTEGASLADSIVGRAAALLCVYSKIIAVYGQTMSQGAVSILKGNSVNYEFGTLVPKILNRRKDDVCPYDKAVSGVENASVALERLKSFKMS
jgi:hypothetical protein